MRRALLLAGALMLVSAPLHAYVSSGSVMGQRLSPKLQSPTTTSGTIDPATTPLMTDDPYVDPEVGLVDVRKDKKLHREDPSNPVPEPGTMAITSMGLLAAAALRKKRAARKQLQNQS